MATDQRMHKLELVILERERRIRELEAILSVGAAHVVHRCDLCGGTCS